MKTILDTFFALRRPCANCPFRKEGAIDLAPGRLEGIVTGLLMDDSSTFHCHKTVHNDRTGGEWDEEGSYRASGRESMCAGAIIYLEKLGRPTIAMRLAVMFGMYDPVTLAASHVDVIDPPRVHIQQKDLKSCC
ncbi:hypothetical protein [Paraburkholderia sp. MM6662-R1]|uniref:hypothetical protein n=1 Tax=Paraburkholderia sp. MM6662-R1 TaxID=2991066 RepID=UPI003D1F8C47